LKFVLQRAAQICDGGVIRPDDLMLEEELDVPETRLARSSNADLATTTRASVEAAECAAIVAALSTFGGDVMKTAAALKISRATLYRKIRQYGLRHQRAVDRDESGQLLAGSTPPGSIYDH
jgi:transcriptional regulator of acetoin/glycerol metabolism